MLRRALRLRPLLATALAAAPLSSSSSPSPTPSQQPVQTFRIQHEQQHEERHVEEPPEPAFVIKIDPAFAYQLIAQLPSAQPPPTQQPQQPQVGIGGLSIGPPSHSPPRAPPKAAAREDASAPPPPPPPSSPSPTTPPASSLPSPATTPAAAAAPTLLSNSGQDQSPADESPSSFLAPFWSLMGEPTERPAPSPSTATPPPSPSPLPPSSAPSPSSPPSSPSSSPDDDPVFLHGVEVGRLSTYREVEAYIARMEAEKVRLEGQLRKVERQVEEERLRGLKGEVMAVEAVKRRTGLQGGGVCEEETRRVLSCYRANMAQVLRCDAVVREFATCADRAKEAVLRAR